MKHLVDRGKTRFIDLSKELKVSKKKLRKRIEKKLMRYGLLYNFYTENEFNDEYLWYEASELGAKVYNYYFGG